MTDSGEGRLVQMRTWVLGNTVYMLTAWVRDDAGEVSRYVLQRYEGGTWEIARSWEPAADVSATALALAALGKGEL